MSDKSVPALTPEQWESRDYRQSAREVDTWAGQREGKGREDDSTEYVAKLGLDDNGCVIVMNRAHDRVLVPPPARPPLAAFALADQPFGFSHADVLAVRRAAETVGDRNTSTALGELAGRLEALLPPAPA